MGKHKKIADERAQHAEKMAAQEVAAEIHKTFACMQSVKVLEWQNLAPHLQVPAGSNLAMWMSPTWILKRPKNES